MFCIIEKHVNLTFFHICTIAAGAYLASKVFEDQMKSLSSGVYSVSGPVSSPEVKFIRVFDAKLSSSRDNGASENQSSADVCTKYKVCCCPCSSSQWNLSFSKSYGHCKTEFLWPSFLLGWDKTPFLLLIAQIPLG